MILVIFYDFPAIGNREKKYKNNNYNEEKKMVVQIWKGYCPNRIVREENCIAREFVLQRIRL